MIAKNEIVAEERARPGQFEELLRQQKILIDKLDKGKKKDFWRSSWRAVRCGRLAEGLVKLSCASNQSSQYYQD